MVHNIKDIFSINIICVIIIALMIYVIYLIIKNYSLKYKSNVSAIKQSFLLHLIYFIGGGIVLTFIPFFRNNLLVLYAITGLTFLLASFLEIIFNEAENSTLFKINHFRFLKHFLKGIVYFLGIAFALGSIPPFKPIAFSVLAGSGILVGIIGIASQQVFSNIVSGVFLQIFTVVTLGDKIKIKGFEGKVTDINLRHTTLVTEENTTIIIPNSVISSEVVERLR